MNKEVIALAPKSFELLKQLQRRTNICGPKNIDLQFVNTQQLVPTPPFILERNYPKSAGKKNTLLSLKVITYTRDENRPLSPDDQIKVYLTNLRLTNPLTWAPAVVRPFAYHAMAKLGSTRTDEWVDKVCWQTELLHRLSLSYKPCFNHLKVRSGKPRILGISKLAIPVWKCIDPSCGSEIEVLEFPIKELFVNTPQQFWRSRLL